MDKTYLQRLFALTLVLVLCFAMSGFVAFAVDTDDPGTSDPGDDGTGTGTPDEPPKLLPFICLETINAIGTKAYVGGTHRDITAEQQSEFEAFCEAQPGCGETATDDEGEEYVVECSADQEEAYTGVDNKGNEAAPDPDVRQGGPKLPTTPALPTITPANLGQLITGLYNWSLRILGIAVFVMITYGGVLWLTAAGRGDQIGKAKSKITNAILGAILLLSAAAILNLINPELTRSGGNLIPPLGAPKPAPPGNTGDSGNTGAGQVCTRVPNSCGAGFRCVGAGRGNGGFCEAIPTAQEPPGSLGPGEKCSVSSECRSGRCTGSPGNLSCR